MAKNTEDKNINNSEELNNEDNNVMDNENTNPNDTENSEKDIIKETEEQENLEDWKGWDTWIVLPPHYINEIAIRI